MVHITSRPSEDFRSYRFSGFPYRLSRALPVARSCFLLRHCALNNFIGHWNLNQLSFAYASCYGLGPGLPWDDERCPGSLRLSVGRILTVLFATYTGILTSARSTSPSGLTSPPLERSPTTHTIRYASTASVIRLAPVHFRRRVTRPVSYYALFKWWLLLSQHPGCF